MKAHQGHEEHEGVTKSTKKTNPDKHLCGLSNLKSVVVHEEEKAHENPSHTRSPAMIFLRALKIDRGPSNKSAQCGRVVDRVSFVLFVTKKAFKSKVNSIRSGRIQTIHVYPGWLPLWSS